MSQEHAPTDEGEHPVTDQTSTTNAWEPATGATQPTPEPQPVPSGMTTPASGTRAMPDADLNIEEAYTRAAQRPPAPPTGLRGLWQRLVGPKDTGPTPEEVQRDANIQTIRRPTHSHRVAVASHKGGVGKTTTSLALGTVLSMFRNDSTVLIDANPDVGTLGSQLTGEKMHQRTVRDLVANADQIRSVQHVRDFTHIAPSRLEVLASDSDPHKARSTSREDYDVAQQVLGTFRDIVITDTGTDMTSSIYDGIIDYTDTLVIAATTAVEDARLAHHTLRTWHERGTNHRGAALVPNAVVAIQVKTSGEVVTRDHLREVFGFARRVVFIPSDPFLAEGTRFDWDTLRPDTQDAFIELAAAVAEDFRPEQ